MSSEVETSTYTFTAKLPTLSNDKIYCPEHMGFPRLYSLRSLLGMTRSGVTASVDTVLFEW